jgi:serine/threonine protein kinase
LIKPFASTTIDHVLNELRAVEKLCQNTMNKHLVIVHSQGRLPDSPYYFIDMELCEKGLDQYITDYHSQHISTGTPSQNSQGAMSEIWRIMRDVTDGLTFIHSHSEIHRDLKPQNSIFPFSHADGQFSIQAVSGRLQISACRQNKSHLQPPKPAWLVEP